MGKIVNIHDARTRLSQLVARAARGERMTIPRGDTPVGEFGPLPRAGTPGR